MPMQTSHKMSFTFRKFCQLHAKYRLDFLVGILTNYWLCFLFYKSVIHRPVSWFVQKHEKQQVYDGVY